MHTLTLLTLLTGSLAAAAPPTPPTYGSGSHLPGCGQVDVIFTGLPPFHPLVTSQGFNGSAVDAGLRHDAADIVKAGYNLRVVLMGPEKDIGILQGEMRGVSWEGAGVGYGVRGSHLQNLTERFTDIVSLYRKEAPRAQMVFDYSFTTALWALQKYIPLSSNCTNSPGKDLGFKIYCDICSGGNSTSS